MSRTVSACLCLFLSAAPALAQAPTPTPTPDAKPSDPASWPADVRALHAKVLALPPKPDRPIVTAMRKLMRRIPASRPALLDLAGRLKSPTPVRVIAAVSLAQFHRFDPPQLTRFLDHKNPFVVMACVERLAALGGPERKALLEKRSSTFPKTKAINNALAKLPAKAPWTPRQLKLLDQLLRGDAKKKQWASVALTSDHPQVAPLLVAISRLAVADKDTQIYCAIALAKIHAKDVKALDALTSLRNSKWVRFEAVKALRDLGEPGHVVLRRLLTAKREPLRNWIEKWLKAAETKKDTPKKTD